jgi:apolipoprotein N-acyltransferase
LYGGIRLALFAPQSKTVHVASLVQDTQTLNLYKSINRNHDNPNPPSSDIALTHNTFSKILDVFLERSKKQAQAGARIVIWSEYGVYTFGWDEEEFIERAKRIAKEEKIYLLMGLIVVTENYPDVYGQNKEIFIDPNGEVLWKYLKSYPVIGGETVIAGDGIIPSVETPYGKIGSAICFDMDHISFIQQTGRKGIDIFLVPAIDWKGIDPFHTNMVSFRALENGFSVVRCCTEGLSAAFDYLGRTISVSDYFSSSDDAMISDIPINAKRTVYSVIGDLFAWMCIAGFAFIIGWIIFKTRRNYV